MTEASRDRSCTGSVIERLRHYAKHDAWQNDDLAEHTIFAEAIDEIERLDRAATWNHDMAKQWEQTATNLLQRAEEVERELSDMKRQAAHAQNERDQAWLKRDDWQQRTIIAERELSACNERIAHMKRAIDDAETVAEEYGRPEGEYLATSLQALVAELSACKKDAAWVPVTERLPEGHDRVLVAWNRGKIEVEHPSGLVYLTERCGGLPFITHWMPLPEPPK